MNLRIQRMTEKFAMEVLCWKYEKPYDCYNLVLTSSAILELVSNRYFAVVNCDSKLIGYFCVGKTAQCQSIDKRKYYEEECIDVGIGMTPKLTGKGNGYSFFANILYYLEENYQGNDLRLTVATFNKRAIHLYEKFGFQEQSKFEENEVEFIVMKRNWEESRKLSSASFI